MAPFHTQRGEGKVGCIVSLLVLVLLVGTAFKAVPVLYSNNELWTTAQEICGRAALLDQTNMTKQIEAKARELEIPEALAPGAIQVSKSGGDQGGTCRLSLNYAREIDFYGIYKYKLATEKSKAVPYMNVN
jgi:hypothetical protein